MYIFITTYLPIDSKIFCISRSVIILAFAQTSWPAGVASSLKYESLVTGSKFDFEQF